MAAALDDARCPKCGKPSASSPAEVYCVDCATEGWEQDAAAHRAARSPQDEGHEAVMQAIMAALISRGWTFTVQQRRDLRAALSCLPSRDGTVAVENWRTTAVQLASLLRELHPQNPYYREKQAEALAAFDALVGESNEGGNQ